MQGRTDQETVSILVGLFGGKLNITQTFFFRFYILKHQSINSLLTQKTDS